MHADHYEHVYRAARRQAQHLGLKGADAEWAARDAISSTWITHQHIPSKAYLLTVLNNAVKTRRKLARSLRTLAGNVVGHQSAASEAEYREARVAIRNLHQQLRGWEVPVWRAILDIREQRRRLSVAAVARACRRTRHQVEPVIQSVIDRLAGMIDMQPAELRRRLFS